MLTLLLLAPLALAQPPADLPVVVDTLVTAVTDAEYASAAERAQTTLDGMGTWTTPPAPADLAALWQILGAVGLYDHRDDLIVPSLTQACAVDPEHFQDRLGPQVQSQWEAACRHVEASASLAVGPLRAESVLWVDGRQVASPAALAPGQHLVQVLTPEREPFVAVVDLCAGQSASLDTGLVLPRVPHPARHAALAGGAGVSLAAAAVLGALAWQAHGVYAGACDLCTDPDRALPCSANTRDAMSATRDRRDALLVGAGVGGGLALAFGVTLAFTW
ncbi:MAG: hypothetical protein ABIO70_20095 [Pseudomonadota bacterium]